MLEKNYIVSQFEETVSPKFLRKQKYLRKFENSLNDLSRRKKKNVIKQTGSTKYLTYGKFSQNIN